MTDKRAIAAIDLPDLTPGQPPTARPEITWMAPTDLLVDESYQRGVGEKGKRLIRRIVEGFDWRRFKPPTAVWTDQGLEVVDGQHSAIAAATHPAIDSIPVVVVEAAEVGDRAGAFLGINKDRLAITPMALHAAAVLAGDKAAAAVERVCQACGVTILRMPPSHGNYKPRDTVAIRAIGDMIKRLGEPVAIETLRVLAEAEQAPITSGALRAVEAILHSEEHADSVEPEDLTRAILALGAEADREAAVFAGTHCVAKWRGLVAVWLKKAKKKRSKAAATQVASLAPAKESKPEAEETARRSAPRHYAPFRDGTYT